MAQINSWFMPCKVFMLWVVMSATCSSDFSRADGAPTELFIFHHSCALKKDEGPCKAVKERFFFDIDTGHCTTFDYGGCQGNANNFETLEECEEMCLVSENKSPCHLEEVPGPCRALVTRYVFDHNTQECRRFFYGGCFGNANNFKTMKECQDRCYSHRNVTVGSKVGSHILEPTKATKPHHQPIISTEPTKPHTQPLISEGFTPPDFCFSPVEKGTCDDSLKRYKFNPKKNRCQWFFYSGCGGNKNNFVHKRHCMKMCMKDPFRRMIRIKTNNRNILFSSV